ncbi:quinone oxidoreductase family protein [Massilia niastensis]|uniref:quinone oxidoreductase family protein n=1 Tax=Massilia niastensis TaxID=544911 RepID=UPI000360CE3D|nr:zinc-binding alcohol dehydrogenase family protein [Massilia niastensis]
MNTIRVTAKAANIDALAPDIETRAAPRPGPGQCVIEIHSAGVNPSDVKAALGAMPHAVWPRTPGRDYAGIVIDGPAELLGMEVWGSGGELGIRRDGTHARYLVLDIEAVRAKPNNISMVEAGAIGVPFITAYEGLRRAGLPQEGDNVLVLGGNGKVGQATIQLATQAGARVFAVERTKEDYIGHASGPVEMIGADSTDIAAHVRDMTGGHGADIVYNTVGSPYFEQANAAMAVGARQIFISTIERPVPFDIFNFYRGQHTYVGIDTLALDSLACARILDALTPGFVAGTLQPFPVGPDTIYSLRDAAAAYRAVLGGARERVVLEPGRA